MGFGSGTMVPGIAAAVPCAGDAGGGRPGQRAAGGDLTAVDTATGYTVQWTSGSEDYTTGDRQAPVTNGVDHTLHDSQPHQRHGITRCE